MSIGQFTFNGFDVVVLLILLVSLLIAVQRGFVREIMSLLALFIAGVISLFIWGQFRYAAQDFISPSWLADVALGAGTFILVYMLFSFILEAPAKPLPDYLAGSTFYPLLNSIGNVIRGLPFAEMRSYADRIKAGELEGISQEILK